jgi:hypothetical protein
VTSATKQKTAEKAGKTEKAVKNGAAHPANPADQPQAFDQAVAQAGEHLINECSKVRVRISWFGTSAKVDEEDAVDMLKGTEADRKAVSISKRLLSSRHKAIVAVNEARRSIENYVSAMTIPMLALTAAGTEDGLRKDAGIRLIQKKDMAAFDDRIKYLMGVLMTSVESFQRALPDIMEEDQKRLGKLFKASDYPTDVAKLVGVDVAYESTQLDLDWETLCPEIYKREGLAAKKKFEAVVENAAVEFATRFVEYVRQVTEQLGHRTRVNTQGTPWAQYDDAEVLEVHTHDSHPEDVSAGHLRLKLRTKPAGGKGRSNDFWLEGEISQKVYDDQFRPYSTDEKRKVYASTIENLKNELEAFNNVGELLGPYKAVIKDSVLKVRELLAKASTGLDAEKIAEQLREGAYFRNEMKSALTGVAQAVQDKMVEATRVRRKIDRKLADLL